MTRDAPTSPLGRALLKFITSDSTFAASWTLKSPQRLEWTGRPKTATQLGSGLLIQGPSLHRARGGPTDRDQTRGSPYRAPPFSFWRHPNLPGFLDFLLSDQIATLPKFASSFPISRGQERRFPTAELRPQHGVGAATIRSFSTGNQEFCENCIHRTDTWAAKFLQYGIVSSLDRSCDRCAESWPRTQAGVAAAVTCPSQSCRESKPYVETFLFP